MNVRWRPSLSSPTKAKYTNNFIKKFRHDKEIRQETNTLILTWYGDTERSQNLSYDK